MRFKSNNIFVLSALVGSMLTTGCYYGDDQKDVDVEGLYYIESSFSTPRGVPEADSTELDSFLDLSGRPDRVAGWVLELLEDELDDPYKSAFRYARDGVDADREFQEFLEQEAPELVESLTALADDVSSVTTSINLISELELEASDVDSFRGTAEHRLTGIVYVVGDQEFRYDFAELGVAAPAAMTTDYIVHDDVKGERVISFGRQDMSLEYGKMLNYALNEIIVENADPFADSFTDLVTSLVPCRKAGEWVEEKIDFGPGEVYGTACAAALDQIGRRLLPLEMDEISVQVDFEGDALLVETEDADNRVDGLTDGEWEGNIFYPSTTFKLRRPDHTFFGNRSRARRNNSDDDVAAE